MSDFPDVEELKAGVLTGQNELKEIIELFNEGEDFDWELLLAFYKRASTVEFGMSRDTLLRLFIAMIHLLSDG